MPMLQTTMALLMTCTPAPAWASGSYIPPSAVPGGWEVVGEPKTFDEDTLFEHINGAAPGYTRYSFRLLTVQPVRNVEDPKLEVLAEVYEFGSHLDAFGIYSCERSTNNELVRLGAEGYYTNTACRFYKGRYYVKLNSSRAGEAARAAQETLAAGIAKSLRGDARHPTLLAAIPQAGIVPNSERYEGADLLAHEFLGAGFTADYDFGTEKKSRLYLAVKGSRAEARSAYYELLRFMRKRGEVGERLELADGRGRMTTHPFYGPSLVCVYENTVCGVLRVPSAEVAVGLVDELVRAYGGLGGE